MAQVNGKRWASRLAMRLRTAFRLLPVLAGIALVGAAFLSAGPSRAAGTLVSFADGAPGSIIVRTSERRLYFVLGNGKALRYKVGVGRSGRQWAGNSSISDKYLKPNWAPPDDVRRDKPGLPDMIPGGSPRNPMGVAAMTLSGGEYAIHGTNAPKTIGGFVSYGCIRMYNQDIAELFEQVSVGTPVFVVR